MDPRVAWIQPEQKGPANALWMHVWETSQGIRTNSAHYHRQQHDELCVNAGFCDVCKNQGKDDVCGEPGCSSSTHHHPPPPPPPPASSSSSSSSHQSNANSTNVRSAFATLSINNNNNISAATPLNASEKAPTEKGSRSPPDPGTTYSDSSSAIRANETNKNRLCFNFSELNNVNQNHLHNHYHHQHSRYLHQEQQPYFQHNCMKRNPFNPGFNNHINYHHHHHHPGRRKNENKASTYGINYLLSNWTNGNQLSPVTLWKSRTYSTGLNG